MADATVRQQYDDGRALIEIVYSSAEQSRAGAPASEVIDVPDPGDDEAVEELVKLRVQEYLEIKAAERPVERIVAVDTTEVTVREDEDDAIPTRG